MEQIVLVGSTGSIGRQTLEVVRAESNEYSILGLAALGNNFDLFIKQIKEFKPKYVSLADKTKATVLQEALTDLHLDGVEVVDTFDDKEFLREIKPDLALNAIVDSIGLTFSLATLQAGVTLALANKESLVAGGDLLKKAVQYEDQILPVDSEHSAIWQCLRSGAHLEVAKLCITASGGPFRGKTRADLEKVTMDDALKHPTWNMGPLITINSSTLVNKGLEVIEAIHLFDIPLEDIEILVHPESIVHSMVQFVDGSIIAQASPPDMKLPISYALAYPRRKPSIAKKATFQNKISLNFEPLDSQTFPAVEIAKSAYRTSKLHPAVYNAANEKLVQAFIDGKILYHQIVPSIVEVLEKFSNIKIPATITIDDVFDAEKFACMAVDKLLAQ
ncbi:MAG: 1-deoxy-D-xylulose-5-phosphate reductoisomerase [Bifidobacteriaceae bacterium]|jgi:1-deoxy-D-xylulose-5-phosphate reductoisomerase|nr:1-deoxy-D-xylulose-5-phosphate reductoisomerase [Bifidobacteriaceae bacterium]